MTNIKSLIGLLFFGAIFISACQNGVNTSFEDSVEPYLELEAIDNTENTIITVNRGDVNGLDSYFSFNLNNTPDHGLVRAGLTEGWWLEWNKAIAQNNDTHGGVEMYSTNGSRTWKPANYLMNIRKELQEEDPSLSYRVKKEVMDFSYGPDKRFLVFYFKMQGSGHRREDVNNVKHLKFY